MVYGSFSAMPRLPCMPDDACWLGPPSVVIEAYFSSSPSDPRDVKPRIHACMHVCMYANMDGGLTRRLDGSLASRRPQRAASAAAGL